MSGPSVCARAAATPQDRWLISKAGNGKRPWLITDTATDPAEDPTLYRFASRKKAAAFKEMLESEAAKAKLAS